jgi:hypothetical protein
MPPLRVKFFYRQFLVTAAGRVKELDPSYFLWYNQGLRNPGSVEILLYPIFGITLGTVMSVTPFLPEEREATQGETPLTPRFRIFFFSHR